MVIAKRAGAVSEYWYLLSLAIALWLGYSLSTTWQGLLAYPLLSRGAVAITIFAMAWPIPFEQIRHSVLKPWPSLWAILVNVGLFPVVAWGFAQGFTAELAAGIIVLGASPTTLASAAVWTRRAGGNDVICLITTIATNGFCFLITPAWVYALAGGNISPGDLQNTVVMLVLAVLLPIVLAQGLRALPRTAVWSTEHKIELGVVAQLGVLWVVFLGVMQAAQGMNGQSATTRWGEILVLVFALSALHLAMWCLAFFGSRWFRFSRPDQIAVGFAASQKTLMVGLAVALQLGFNVVPLVIYHILQLIIDSLLVGGLRRYSR